MAQPTIAVSAYTAGIIDGEGCLYIRKSKRRPETPRSMGQPLAYTAHLEITSIDPRLPLWLRGNWGGHVNELRTGYSGFNPGRTYYRWQVSATQIPNVLKAVLPYLRIKAEQARVLIEFQVLSTGNRGKQWRHTSFPDYEKYYLRLKALKRQHAAAETERLGTVNGEATVQPSVKAETSGT